MTPRQRELARHALGLPNRTMRSYRNRFSCGEGANHDVWTALVDRGIAGGEPGSPLSFFWLTPAGAMAALDRGESLCPEDFPAVPERVAT